MPYTPRVHAADRLKLQNHTINKQNDKTQASYMHVHGHLFIKNEEERRKEIGSTLKINNVFEIQTKNVSFCFSTIL
jgi:hypothetical protein